MVFSGLTTYYSFNKRNQLLEVVSKDENNQTIKTLSFTYDGLNRRYTKTITINNETKSYRYIYDGYDIVAIYDNTSYISNPPLSLLTHGEQIDQPLSIKTNNQNYYYQRDHLGSIYNTPRKTNNYF